MNKILKIFDKFQVCLWTIVIMILVSVAMTPFTTKTLALFGMRMHMTPILILLPMLLGVTYAVTVSYETPKMDKKKKMKFRIIKAITFTVFLVLDIAAILYVVL